MKFLDSLYEVKKNPSQSGFVCSDWGGKKDDAYTFAMYISKSGQLKYFERNCFGKYPVIPKLGDVGIIRFSSEKNWMDNSESPDIINSNLNVNTWEPVDLYMYRLQITWKCDAINEFLLNNGLYKTHEFHVLCDELYHDYSVYGVDYVYITVKSNIDMKEFVETSCIEKLNKLIKDNEIVKHFSIDKILNYERIK